MPFSEWKNLNRSSTIRRWVGGLARGRLEREQRTSRRRQVLFALREVVVEKSIEEFVGHGHHPRIAEDSVPFSSVRAVAARVCGANGLVR